uniref:hypothetical protein n=1 Tax=Bacillus sp. JCM 19041 TaxID=1460637 RepID=UPI000A73C558
MFIKMVRLQLLFKIEAFHSVFFNALFIQLIGLLVSLTVLRSESYEAFSITYCSTDMLFIMSLLSVVYVALVLSRKRYYTQVVPFVTNGLVNVASTYLCLFLFSCVSAIVFACSPYAHRVLLSIFADVNEFEQTLSISSQFVEFSAAFLFYLLIAASVLLAAWLVHWKRFFLVIILSLIGFFLYGWLSLGYGNSNVISNIVSSIFDFLFLTSSLGRW